LAALLHGSQVVSVSQTLRRWTEGATYVRQGDHYVGHWPTFLVIQLNNNIDFEFENLPRKIRVVRYTSNREKFMLVNVFVFTPNKIFQTKVRLYQIELRKRRRRFDELRWCQFRFVLTRFTLFEKAFIDGLQFKAIACSVWRWSACNLGWHVGCLNCSNVALSPCPLRQSAEAWTRIWASGFWSC